MSKVIVKRATYDYEALKPQIYEMLDSFVGDLIVKNSRVVIKPNLLAPASPDKAMLTHPLIVRAVAEYVIEKGGKARISDSPAMGTFERVMKESGIRDALQGLDVECREFSSSVTADVGEPFNKIELAEDALQADILINLPKLKTHSQMLLTLGVKNLFGCVVGFRKPGWHFRTGVDREMFATLLVSIYRTIRPTVTILDGILAMEGEGPGKSGVPKRLEMLLASDDAVALDTTVCRMLGVDPKSLLTNRAAEGMGLAPESIVVEGELPRIDGFELPRIVPLVFGPKFSHGMLRRHMVQRPVADDAVCKSCGDCERYCPAKAIARRGKKLAFDYEKCIRCYCCIEVCPYGALKTEEPLLGRIVNKFMNRDS